MKILSVAALSIAALLAGCATVQRPQPTAAAVQSAAQINAPVQWHTPLPHGGNSAALAAWWTQLGDPLLPELIAAAQTENATLAAAQTRIAQARAAQVAAQGALGPQVNATGSASRGVFAQAPKANAATSLSAGLQAGWEIDLFGGNGAARDAATLRLEGAQTSWHGARVTLAADTAGAYYGYRHCENVRTLTQSDATSRAETARLSDLTAKAGFNAPANAALARASAADAASNVRTQQAQCDLLVKSLVALSGMDEPALRQKLEENKAAAKQIQAQAALFSIANLPANLLMQRPDLAAAQRTVVAASADVAAADAKRLPTLSLNGSIGGARVSSGGASQEGLTWSLGPVAINFPLIDQGRNAANVLAAQAAYDEAVVSLRAQARNAVREVEEALVNLNSVAGRQDDVQTAATGYKAALDAAQARYRSGLGTLTELEDARRTALASQQSLLQLERERIAAWISLYRAAGGGWDASTLAQTRVQP